MKKLIAALLICCLCLTAVSSIAAQFANTGDFCSVLDEYGIRYTLSDGLNQYGDEIVVIENKDGNGHPYTIAVSFSEDNELIYMCVYWFITYRDSDFTDVVLVCNELNYRYHYVKFYADQEDNTVTADLDIIVREGQSVREIAEDGLIYLAETLEEAYEELSVFDIGE